MKKEDFKVGMKIELFSKIGEKHCSGLNLGEVYTVNNIEDKRVYIISSYEEHLTIWNCCFRYVKKVKSTLMDLKI